MWTGTKLVAKEIWLGPVLGNNRERLLARCAEYVSQGQTDRLLYIAASHPLLDLVTEKLLDGKTAQGVWGEFPIYLFRGFVRRVLSEATVSEPGAVATGSAQHVGESAERSLDPVAIAHGSETLGLAPRTPIDREELPLRHSLVSQIIKQLSSAGKLTAIRPLAYRDGCVNTVASLIGEIQRAGKSPDEFREAIEAREIEAQDSKSKIQSPKAKNQKPKSQIDFDRDVALIYSTYAAALDKNNLTDEDADQLRALQVMRGEVAQVVNLRPFDEEPEQSQINNLRYTIPWLNEIDLLVLDGFFDFTPV